MTSRRPQVTIGLLGPTLDRADGPGRWERWRPTVSLCQHEDRLVDRLAQRCAMEQAAGESFLKGGIVTRDAAFNRLIAEIEHVAAHGTDPILLTGPTGAGKSRLARRIHELKKHRRQLTGPLVEVNCATVRGDTAMSTLFGHVRGSFTGAANARAGLLRAADGGLLFLDEVGELGPDEQTMLLRAIEEKRFLPVGADAEVGSDFQLVCGTHRDLGADARVGRFREDLLARIRLWSFRLPGLAERLDDLEPNLDFELEEHTRRTGSRVRFNLEARRRFFSFASRSDATFSGNFRDLAAAVRRMATLAPAGRITEAVVDGEAARLRDAWGSTAPISPLAGVLTPEQLADLDLFDAAQLEKVVEVCRASESLSAAGRTLFATSREKKSSNDADRLRKYLARFGLEFGSFG